MTVRDDSTPRRLTRRRLTLAAVATVAALGTIVCCGGAPSQTPEDAVVTPSDDAATGEAEPNAPASPDASRPDAAACPSVGAATTPGTVSAAAITEASGVVASARNGGVYWTHNDGDDGARAFALGRDGALRATLTFDAALPVDIEDVAIEDVSATASFLYFGDIGDNDEDRAAVLRQQRHAPPALLHGDEVRRLETDAVEADDAARRVGEQRVPLPRAELFGGDPCRDIAGRQRPKRRAALGL